MLYQWNLGIKVDRRSSVEICTFLHLYIELIYPYMVTDLADLLLILYCAMSEEAKGVDLDLTRSFSNPLKLVTMKHWRMITQKGAGERGSTH